MNKSESEKEKNEIRYNLEDIIDNYLRFKEITMYKDIQAICDMIQEQFYIIPKSDPPEKWVENELELNYEDYEKLKTVTSKIKLKWREDK